MKVSIISALMSLCLIFSSAFGQENELSRPGYECPIDERTKQIIEEVRSRSPEEIEKRRNKWKEAIKASDRDIIFRGQVVDLDGKPVSDAVVAISVRSFDPTDEIFMDSKEHRLITDSKGSFKFEGKGMSLDVRDIIKDGYEFKREYLDYFYFMYDEKIIKGNSGKNLPFDPDSKMPFVFKIRQLGTVNYLFTNSFTWAFRKSENNPFAPLLLGEWKDRYGETKNPGAHRLKQNKSLEIACSFDEDYSEFQLVFQCDANDCGIILSQDVLYEAPDDGYQQKVNYNNTMVREVNEGSVMGWHDKKLYLYVKGPEGSYYSRIDLWIRTSPITQYNEDALVQVGGEIYTNPEGLRYLDYDERFNDDEERFRSKIHRERSKVIYEARKNKKPFDEKAFREKVDQEREAKKQESKPKD